MPTDAAGNWIGFVQQGALKKVSVQGGPALTLCSVPGGTPRGATWGPDNTIVFSVSTGAPGLLCVSAAGGEPETLTTPDARKGERVHLWPEFLPGGRAVLFTIERAKSNEGPQISSGFAIKLFD